MTSSGSSVQITQGVDGGLINVTIRRFNWSLKDGQRVKVPLDPIGFTISEDEADKLRAALINHLG